MYEKDETRCHRVADSSLDVTIQVYSHRYVLDFESSGNVVTSPELVYKHGEMEQQSKYWFVERRMVIALVLKLIFVTSKLKISMPRSSWGWRGIA